MKPDEGMGQVQLGEIDTEEELKGLPLLQTQAQDTPCINLARMTAVVHCTLVSSLLRPSPSYPAPYCACTKLQNLQNFIWNVSLLRCAGVTLCSELRRLPQACQVVFLELAFREFLVLFALLHLSQPQHLFLIIL